MIRPDPPSAQLGLFAPRRIGNLTRFDAMEEPGLVSTPAPARPASLPADEPPHPRGPIARRTDVVSSHDAAADVTAGGQRDLEAARVLLALRRHPGQTSHELARLSADIGQRIGQETDAWRTTLGRRLVELEDAGLADPVSPSPSRARPNRRVDSAIQPCSVTGHRALRWWPA